MVKNNIFRLARAKINLDLLICGRRADGYHLLDSLVVFADYGDEISVCPADRLTLKVTGPFARHLSGEKNNIILRAARLLRDRFDICQGAEISLVKHLPVSSGIGGGSADGAAVLHALGELWNISDRIADMDDLAISLGADVPVCMASETMQMGGVGEILRPVTLDFPLYLTLVNPGVSVSTKDIFAARVRRDAVFSSSRHLPDRITTLTQLRDILLSAGNDLQYDACESEPEIGNALEQISKADQCIFTAMSGSGATCFGLFPTCEAAQRAGRNIFRDFPRWWVQPVKVS